MILSYLNGESSKIKANIEYFCSLRSRSFSSGKERLDVVLKAHEQIGADLVPQELEGYVAG